MSVRDIIKDVIRSAVPFRRERRLNSFDFQPLDPFDLFREQEQDGSTFRESSESPDNQPQPIEMRNFSSVDAQSSMERQGRLNRNESHPEQLVPPPLQVYNPTSEELSQCDHGTQIPNVRLVLRDEDENIENSNDTHSENEDEYVHQVRVARGGNCFQKCMSCSWVPMKWKQRAMVTCAIIVVVGCIFITMLFMGLGGMNGVMPHRDRHSHKSDKMGDNGLQILRNLQWPLHDVLSRKLNISFDTMDRAHKIWNFDKDESGEASAKRKKNNVSKNANREFVYVEPTINGVKVNEAILLESYTLARTVLRSNSKLNQTSSKLELLGWTGLANVVAVEELNRKLNLSLAINSLQGTLPPDLCNGHYLSLDDHKCNITTPFRSIDGRCNNVLHSLWGSQYSPFRRIIDWNSIPREHHRSKLNSNDKEKSDSLPSPHLISTTKHKRKPETDPDVSALLPFWGMLIFHDTVKVADAPVSCCTHHEGVFNDKNAYKIHDNDVTCSMKHVSHFTHGPSVTILENGKDMCSSFLPFPAIYPSCELNEPRSSFNLATSFIDASNIYGSSLKLSDKLRRKEYGMLRVEQTHHQIKQFLLQASHENETCHVGNPINANVPYCVISGDPDVNEVLILTSLSTILMRQHNLISSFLHLQNRHWDDERVFQESRRILIAQIQHITYNEFLPEVLGKEMIKLAKLELEKEFYELYDPAVDTTASNAFAGALGQFFWSMISGQMKTVQDNEKGTQEMPFPISNLFYAPHSLYRFKGTLEALFKVFSSQNANHVGIGIPKELLALHVKSTGSLLNLIEMVIQRSRELNIAPYIEWRKVCGFPEVKDFQELKDQWDLDAYETLTQVYKNANQIDLFTGMLAEKHIPSGRVGPTLACLLADQFLRFRKGDRFWYEGDVYPHHFTQEQLNEIRKTTLARIICDNTNNDLRLIQKLTMLIPSKANPLIPCPQIPQMNFSLWAEPNPNHIPEAETNSSEDLFRGSIEYDISGEMHSAEKAIHDEKAERKNIKRISPSNPQLEALFNKISTLAEGGTLNITWTQRPHELEIDFKNNNSTLKNHI